MYPAAVLHDIVTHDTVTGSGTIAAPGGCTSPHKVVLVQGKMAAHVGHLVMCTGATAAGPAAPAHPPGAPPVTPKGTGSNLGKRRELEAKERREQSAANFKSLTIQVLSGRKGTPAVAGSFAIELDLLITDPQTAKFALYKYVQHAGVGGSLGFPGPQAVTTAHKTADALSEVLNIGADAAGVDNKILGGKPAALIVDPGTDVTDFVGGARYEESSILMFEDNDFHLGMNSQGQRYNVELNHFVPSTPSLATVGSSYGELVLVVQIDFGGEPPSPPPKPGIFPIVSGSSTVLIHGMPAARIMPSSDKAACGCSLGHPSLIDTRTVLIGG